MATTEKNDKEKKSNPSAPARELPQEQQEKTDTAQASAETKAAEADTAQASAEGKTADQAKKAEKPENDKSLLDEIAGDDGDLILDDIRVSIPLTAQNARFFRSQGGLVSLELSHADEGKDPEIFERVMILRAFPVTNPDEFLCVREPETRKGGRPKEIGMIRHMTDFDEPTQRLFLEELDRRYFSPVLLKITSCKEKFGYSYWEAETDAGHVTFILNNPFMNIRLLEDGRIFINDIDGNSFVIPDPKKLDPASYRKIEMYL